MKKAFRLIVCFLLLALLLPVLPVSAENGESVAEQAREAFVPYSHER